MIRAVSSGNALFAVAENHDFYPMYSIKVPELITQFSNPFNGAPTEQRLETPLSMMGMTRVENYVLILVLNTVKVLYDFMMPVIESDECNYVAGQLFKPRMRLDVLLHRFSDCP